MEINKVIDKEVLDNSIKHYGKELQSIVCMEEMAELTQCISKELRYKGDKTHLTEELADVIICVEMLKIMYDIDKANLEEMIKYKQERIKDRMAEETI